MAEADENSYPAARPYFNDKDMNALKPKLGKGIYKNSKDKNGDNTPPFYPSIFTDPATKQTKEYALANDKTLYYNNWYYWQNAFGNNYRQRYIDNRNWSNGKQDVRSFMGGKKPKQDLQQNPYMKHLDFDPVTEQSKYRDIIVGYLEELDFEVTATTLNPMAAALRENKRLNEIVIQRQKASGFTQAVNQKAGQNVMPESQLPFPVTDEKEINLYYQLGGAKEMYELEIEIANQVVLNDSDWSQIKKMLLEDAFDTGIYSCHVIYDKDGRIKVKYVDPVNTGVEDFRGHYLNRPDRIWYMELKTIQEIWMESQGQFTLKEMHELAHLFEGMFGNPLWTNTYNAWNQYFNTDSNYIFGAENAFFNSWKVPVMHTAISEIDMYPYIEYTNAGGHRIKTFTSGEGPFEEFLKTLPNEGIYAPAPEERDPDTDEIIVPLGGANTTAERLQLHRYYRSTWILNTNYVYDYGRNPMPARDPYNPRYEQCPIKYYRIAQQPMGERIKGWAKKIYNTCLKLDNEVARMVPTGAAINVKSIENITLGTGESLTLKYILEIYNQTGTWLYADEAQGDMLGQTRGKRTIDPIPQMGWKDKIDGYISLINFYLQRIASLTGINEYMDASNPNPNTPVALAQQAQNGTKNSMSQITSGFLFFTEKIALDVAERVRKVVEITGNYSGYADALGTGMMQFISVTPQVVPHRFAIRVRAKPTRAEKEALKQHIYQAFSNLANTEQGGLWVVDVLRFEDAINNGVSFKIIRLELNAVLQDRMNKAQQDKMAMIDKQVQGNNQQNQQAQQGQLQQSQEELRQKMIFEHFLTGEIMKRNGSLVWDKTQGAMQQQQSKSLLKRQEDMQAAALDNGR